MTAICIACAGSVTINGGDVLDVLHFLIVAIALLHGCKKSSKK
jgi:hypothetical protein